MENFKDAIARDGILKLALHMYSRFKTWKRHHQVLFGLLLGIGVISLWRGVWGLSDAFLFSGNSVMSYIASVVVGVVIISAAHYAIEGRE